MEHFSEQAWTDFVRGVGSSEQPGEMESHLASGCNDCAEARDAWTRVHIIAARESTYSPPEGTVRIAKLEFAARPFERGTQPVSAKLIFDTSLQPALAGVRAAATASARQMVYEADGLTVDMRFDAPPRSTKMHLTGQVLDQRVPRASLQDAAVILWTDRGLPIAETKANAFGEFNLEFEAQYHLRLSIQVVSRALIRIPLVDLRPTNDAADISDVSNQ